METKNGRLAALGLALLLAFPSGALAQVGAAPNTAAGQAGTQVPQPQQGGVNWSGAGYGAAALFGNLLYIPAKVLYAVGGGLVGGGSYLVTGGNKQVSDTIFRSSLGGDYVLTPEMLEGKKPVYFSGPNQVPPAPNPGAAGTLSSSAPAQPGTTGRANNSYAAGAASGGGIASSNIGGASSGGSSASGSAAAPSNGSGSSSAASAPMDSGTGPVAPSHSVPAPPLSGTRIE